MSVKTFSDGVTLPASDINSFLANAGLVYVTSTTFSGSTSVQINNCWTTTYDEYRIVMRLTSSVTTNGYLAMRWVDGTTPVTTSTYYNNQIYSAGASAPQSNYYGAVSVAYVGWVSDLSTTITLDLVGPQLSGKKSWVGMCSSFSTDTAINGSSFGFSITSAAYEGVQFFPASGTFSGTIYVYGYRKA